MEQAKEPLTLELMNIPKKTGGTHDTSAVASASPTFEEVFSRNWPLIYGLLARMVGDPSEAEDLALETFHRLYRRPDRDRSGFHAAGWLRRTAINLGLHSIRAFRRRLAHELQAGRQMLEESPADSPIRTIAERDEHRQARLVLADLSPRHSQLLLMRYSGASYREIATALSLSPTSIGPLLLRAEREFARRYREIDQEET